MIDQPSAGDGTIRERLANRLREAIPVLDEPIHRETIAFVWRKQPTS